VTPQVNEGDSVVLDIEQEVNSLTGATVLASAAAADLITNERKIQTKVLAADGRIVVLGGLIKDDVQSTEQRVPLLGDIPLLGRLFRNDAVSVTKTNLLIFIRPTIIRDDRQLAGATALKYRFIRDRRTSKRSRAAVLRRRSGAGTAGLGGGHPRAGDHSRRPRRAPLAGAAVSRWPGKWPG
jgi:general secretion pathway protein D